MAILAGNGKWEHSVDGIEAVVPRKSSHDKFVDYVSASDLRICRDFIVTPISK